MIHHHPLLLYKHIFKFCNCNTCNTIDACPFGVQTNNNPIIILECESNLVTTVSVGVIALLVHFSKHVKANPFIHKQIFRQYRYLRNHDNWNSSTANKMHHKSQSLRSKSLKLTIYMNEQNHKKKLQIINFHILPFNMIYLHSYYTIIWCLLGGNVCGFGPMKSYISCVVVLWAFDGSMESSMGIRKFLSKLPNS